MKQKPIHFTSNEIYVETPSCFLSEYEEVNPISLAKMLESLDAFNLSSLSHYQNSKTKQTPYAALLRFEGNDMVFMIRIHKIQGNKNVCAIMSADKFYARTFPRSLLSDGACTVSNGGLIKFLSDEIENPTISDLVILYNAVENNYGFPTIEHHLVKAFNEIEAR